tara:strand:+ start:314 stop:529 length:216 start_codon:yes stop_codon:yes gene_type:complete
MKNYIENSQLSITYIYIGEVQTSEFNTDQEFKDFMLDNNIILLVSTSRNYTETPDYEILQNYNDLLNRFSI